MRPKGDQHGGPYDYTRKLWHGSNNTPYADPRQPVPILYGRRRIPGRIVEMLTGHADVSDPKGRFIFWRLCEGEVHAVHAWYLDGELQAERYQATGDQLKLHGIYVRRGVLGLDGDELLADYQADPTTQERPQNRDYRSLAGATYSRTCYVLSITPEASNDEDKDEVPELAADVQGLKVRSLTRDGQVVATAYSVNPIWQAVDLLTARRYGGGLRLEDCDHAVHVDEAAYAGAAIASDEASTTVTTGQASATTTCKVASTEGFVRGRACKVDGVDNTVVDVVDGRTLQLGTAVTQDLDDAVVQYPARFESHVYLADNRDLVEQLRDVLATCRGYVTYDSGRVQVRVERALPGIPITDGALDDWTSDTNLTSWLEIGVPTYGAVRREQTIVHTAGGSSCKLERGGTAGNLGIESPVLADAVPGAYYVLRFWARAADSATDLTNMVQVILHMRRNGIIQSSYRGRDADGTWVDEHYPAYYTVDRATLTKSWAEYRMLLRIDPDTPDGDAEGATWDHRLQLRNAKSAVGDDCYLDDVSIEGPYAGDFRELDPLPGAGIKEGTFKLQPEAEGDREINRIVVPFFNESTGAEDELVHNDHEHQKRHPVREADINGVGLVDRDQAYRLADWRMRRLRNLGDGATFDAGPLAQLVQPGDVVLVSADVPSWTWQPKRVVSVDVQGEGEADETFCRLTVEDYLASVYPDADVPARAAPTEQLGTLTLAANGDTGNRIALSWNLDSDTGYVRHFEVHRVPAGEDTSGDTLVTRTPRNAYTYQVPDSDVDEAHTFRVLAVTDRATIASADLTLYPHGTEWLTRDPTFSEQEHPSNLVYAGGFTDPDEWDITEDAATETILRPTGSYNGNEENQFSSRTNAADGSDATNSSGSVDGLAPTEEAESAWTFNQANTGVRGRVKSRCYGSLGLGSLFPTQRGYYRIKPGGWQQFFSTRPGAAKQTFTGPLLEDVDVADLEYKHWAKAGSNVQQIAYLTDVWFSMQDPTYGAYVGNGTVAVWGNGTTYGEVYRAFPGKTPTAEARFRTGDELVVYLEAHRNTPGVPPAGDMQVFLRDPDSSTTVAVLTLAAADVGDAWRAYRGYHKFTADLAGPLLVGIRHQGTGRVECRNLGITLGDQVWAYQLSDEERAGGNMVDTATYGRPARFDRARWANMSRSYKIALLE